METPFKHSGPCTVFFLSDLGIGVFAAPAKMVSIEDRPYAQYARSLRVTLMPPRARKWGKQFTRTPVSGGSFDPVIVVEGIHGAPDAFTAWEEGPNGTKTRRGLFSSCDPGWEGLMRSHIASLGARVLFDSAEVMP